MRAVCDKRRKLMVELMREVGFSIPVMPHGAFYVFADASRWTDHSYKFAFELLERAGVGVAQEADFGQAEKRAVRFSYASGKRHRPKSMHDPGFTSSHQNLQVRFRCSVFVNARGLGS
jgi:aspartate/methionine/tyrosine aminotransferase